MSKERLEFKKYTIKSVYDDIDRLGNNCTSVTIANGWVSTIPLYDNDLKLLLGLLKCSKEELVDKKVIAVGDGTFCRAIGYGGKYFRLYYRDNSSRLLSLDELRASLEVKDYIAFDDNDREIDMDTLLKQCESEIVPEVEKGPSRVGR